MTLVILAAGMGSRYGGNKQLDGVGPHGEIILDYSIFDARRAGFDRVLLVIKREHLYLFRENVETRFHGSIRVDYAFQEPDLFLGSTAFPANRVKPWGTGHALLCCKDQLQNERFAVINADDFYGEDAFRLLAKHFADCKQNEFCMVGYRLQNTVSPHGTVSRGICALDKNGMLQTIRETTSIGVDEAGVFYPDETGGRHPLEADSVVSMNTFGFTDAFLPSLEAGFTAFLKKNAADLSKCEYYLPSAVQGMIDAKQCTMRVYTSGDRWYGVTYREDRPFVCDGIRSLTEQGKYPEKLF